MCFRWILIKGMNVCTVSVIIVYNVFDFVYLNIKNLLASKWITTYWERDLAGVCFSLQEGGFAFSIDGKPYKTLDITEGTSWKRRRHMLTPTFSANKLRLVCVCVCMCVCLCVCLWSHQDGGVEAKRSRGRTVIDLRGSDAFDAGRSSLHIQDILKEPAMQFPVGSGHRFCCGFDPGTIEAKQSFAPLNLHPSTPPYHLTL